MTASGTSASFRLVKPMTVSPQGVADLVTDVGAFLVGGSVNSDGNGPLSVETVSG
jgi:hypothetical protein